MADLDIEGEYFMKTNKHELSKKLFKMEYENLTDPQKHVLHHISEGTHISREVLKEMRINQLSDSALLILSHHSGAPGHSYPSSVS